MHRKKIKGPSNMQLVLYASVLHCTVLYCTVSPWFKRLLSVPTRVSIPREQGGFFAFSCLVKSPECLGAHQIVRCVLVMCSTPKALLPLPDTCRLPLRLRNIYSSSLITVTAQTQMARSPPEMSEIGDPGACQRLPLK